MADVSFAFAFAMVQSTTRESVSGGKKKMISRFWGVAMEIKFPL